MSFLSDFRDAFMPAKPDLDAMALELRTNPLENPGIPLSGASLVDLFGDGYGATASSRLVNADTALRQTVVFACVRVLCETIAALPLNVYKRSPTKTLANDHPLYRTLHDESSSMLTAYMFRETGMMHYNVFGNWYALISRLPGGDVNLLLMYPPLVTPRVTSSGLKYDVRTGDGMQTYDASEVIHIPGMSFDGYRGISATLHAARESIGVALAAEEHTGRFFSNGARVAGVLQTEHVLNDEVVARIKAQWMAAQTGLANAYKTAILEQGLKYQTTTMQSDQAELVQTRQFQVEDLCRPFRVPPMFAGEYGKSTYSNMEQSDIHFAKHTINPICVKIQQEFNRKLFDDPEYFCEFDTEGLTQGDFATRMGGFAKAIQGAIYTPNEVRAKMGLPPMDGGDDLYMQQNMSELEALDTDAQADAGEKTQTSAGDNA
jgi:HK97 family phage portal protein